MSRLSKRFEVDFMIYEIKGNLLNTRCDYICHQVNCMGKMNSGVAKAIRLKWPEVYDEYRVKCDEAEDFAINNKYEVLPADYLLGHIQIVNADGEGRYVINMFAQQNYGYDGCRYTSYDAFQKCLDEIKAFIGTGSSLAFPKNIGCCRGGANWNVIKTMITEALCDYDVYIYELEE